MFVSRRHGNLDLYLLGVDDDDLVRLTDDPTDEELPAFAPDGTRIAFNTLTPRGDSDIAVIDSDGTNRHVFNRSSADWAPTWSPDGSAIAFARQGEGIWVMEADGSNERRLSPPDANDRWPAWGPTGRIAFVSAGDLWTMADDGSDRRRLLQTPEEEFLPSWSPDGDVLAYTRAVGAGLSQPSGYMTADLRAPERHRAREQIDVPEPALGDTVAATVVDSGDGRLSYLRSTCTTRCRRRAAVGRDRANSQLGRRALRQHELEGLDRLGRPSSRRSNCGSR